MRLATATWTEVEHYLKSNKTLILPIGSTEQHGPTGLLGTDHLTADAIALEIGKKLGILVAPPLCYGMAAHHMDFAGSVTLKPSTYQLLLKEVLGSFYHHGFRNFHLINGHGGNENSVRAVFQELKAENLSGAAFSLYNWWRMPEISALATELYGDREGFHATPSEVSLTFHLQQLAPRPYSFVDKVTDSMPWPLTAAEVKRIFPTGVMKADPGLAHPEHGERFFKVAIESISRALGKAAAF
jgi:creatinine amidohydrolase